jgi:hypothetical protein
MMLLHHSVRHCLLHLPCMLFRCICLFSKLLSHCSPVRNPHLVRIWLFRENVYFNLPPVRHLTQFGRQPSIAASCCDDGPALPELEGAVSQPHMRAVPNSTLRVSHCHHLLSLPFTGHAASVRPASRSIHRTDGRSPSAQAAHGRPDIPRSSISRAGRPARRRHRPRRRS